MYIRLPDFDYFRCYDLGAGGILSQISHKIYDNIHKPTWETLKRHLFMAEIAKTLFKDPQLFRGAIKVRFQAGTNVWRGSENTNREYFQRIGRNGFSRLWGFRHIPARSGRIFAFSGHHFIGAKRKKGKWMIWFEKRRFQIGRRCLGRLELSLWVKIPDLPGEFPKNFVPIEIQFCKQ